MCVLRPHIYEGRMCVRSCHLLSLWEWGPSERQEACGSASCFLCWYSALDPVSLQLFNAFLCRIRGLIFARWFCRSAALGLCRPHMHMRHVVWLDMRKFSLSKIRFRVLFIIWMINKANLFIGFSLQCVHTPTLHASFTHFFFLNFPLPSSSLSLSLSLSFSF